MIFTGFAPNIEFDDFILAIKLLMPWNWGKLKTGKAVLELNQTISSEYNQYCFLVDSGRNALHQLLRAYKFPKNSEIIIQAFTCSVVPHAIKRTKLKPVYVDITKQYNIDPNKLKNAITPKTKAVIVQHTFGIPAEIQKIKKICDDHNIILIEDLAHSLGTTINNEPVGSFGDSAIMSFGSNKTISCSRGGAIITHDAEMADLLKQVFRQLPAPPLWMIIQNLLQPIIFYISKPLYNKKSVGKAMLYLARKLRLLPTVVSKSEKNASGHPNTYPLANSLARQLVKQWQKLPRFVEHRQKIGKLYQQAFKQNLPIQTSPMMYPVQVLNSNRTIRRNKVNNIILGDWHHQVVEPKDANMGKCGYQVGSCPQAEELIKHVVNLPTNIGITEKAARKVIKITQQAAKQA